MQPAMVLPSTLVVLCPTAGGSLVLQQFYPASL